MELDHSFTVPVPPAQAWPVLLDVERVAPCLPGATVDSREGDEFTGRVRVKVGPITVTYRGQARFVEQDAEAYRVVIEANGKETRGAGTARATVTARLAAQGEDFTRVTVTTTLDVTGRPAQFGRGVLADVGARLIAQFATCLADQLAAGQLPAAEPADGGATGAVATGAVATGAAVAGARADAVADQPGGPPEQPPVAVEPSQPASPIAPPEPLQPVAPPEPLQPIVPPEPGPPAEPIDPPQPAGSPNGFHLPATRPTPEALDLWRAAALPVARRVALPLAALTALAAVLVWRRRR